MCPQEDQLEISFCARKDMSYRAIARKVGCTPRTAKKYAEHPELIGKQRKPAPPRSTKLDPYHASINQYLTDDPLYRASTIYDKLCKQGYPGGYEQVKRAVRAIRQREQQKAYIRFETEPGAQGQVDYGELQVLQADGSVVKLYLFAMILGYSREPYFELQQRCDIVSFLEAHQRAFAHFGGTPHEVLYDRMRNVFIRRLAGKDQFTQGLVDLAVHYGFAPRVAPAYAPWVKGKVERPFDFVRESFWRGYAFSNIEAAQRDLAAWAAEKSKRVHGTTHERVDERFEREKPHLQPLPPAPCDVSERLYRTVCKDCSIAVHANRYVVPHTLVGKKVLVRLRHDELRVFDDDKLVATYWTPEGKGHFVSDPKFYEALKADREMQERKYNRAQGHKGRATISPNKPLYPIDVQLRPIAQYTQIGGEVGYA